MGQANFTAAEPTRQGARARADNGAADGKAAVIGAKKARIDGQADEAASPEVGFSQAEGGQTAGACTPRSVLRPNAGRPRPSHRREA